MTDVLAIWAESQGWIGKNGGLPWPTIKQDLARFRAATTERTLIMGRRTFESLPDSMKTPESTMERPLVVLTTSPRNVRMHADAYWFAAHLETPEAVKLLAESLYGKPLAVIGGRETYEFMRPVVNRVSITLLSHPEEDTVGDVRAPYRDLRRSLFCEGSNIDPATGYEYCFHAGSVKEFSS